MKETQYQNALPERFLLHGQYEIKKILGKGGFGITYLAYDCREKRYVAIKELFPCKDIVREAGSGNIRVLSGQESFFAHVKQRFLEEAQMLLDFQQVPNIVKILRLFEENHTAYYVMEYLEGMDLKQYLREKGRLPWNQLEEFVRMLLGAMAALHRRGMIHRDISPDNIFLTNDGRAVLIDFGSARSYSDNNGFTTFLKDSFAPYEQYRENGNQGPWTDIYSFSVSLYYALSKTLPPKAPDRMLKDNLTYIGQLCPDLPERVARGITRGMAVRPELRYQNVEELAEQLFPGEGVWRTGQVVENRQLLCKQGYYQGKAWDFKPGEVLALGREGGNSIVYPPKAPGVSRKHCAFLLDRQGKLYVRDEGSSYGTFLNGSRLRPQTWYLMEPGAIVALAQEIYQVQ